MFGVGKLIHPSVRLKYYKREDVREAIVSAAQDKEVAVKYGDKGYGKRPDVLNYSKDVLEFVKQGATSFHCSEELWNNPLQLSAGMQKQELDVLRKGWDLVLDIDCNWLEYSVLAADLVVQALKYHGISSVSVKFSGNRGFHIAVPFEAFPQSVHNIPVKDLFPDAPRKIAAYIKEMIAQKISDKIMEFENYDFGRIKRKIGLPENKIVKKTVQGTNYLNTEHFLNIDTILISSRHLYRMPYCFNEKSGLVSVPVEPDKILEFTRDAALSENVRVTHDFLERKNVERGEAKKLLVQALDFHPPQQEKKAVFHEQPLAVPDAPIPVENFPPCIQNILCGLRDGRKRAAFILTNFLTSAGWNYEKSEILLREWNQRNTEPLRENALLAPLKYHQHKDKKVLPPSCSSQYYSGIGVCKPDNLCGANKSPGSPGFVSKVKNPVMYARKKQKLNYLTKKQNKTK